MKVSKFLGLSFIAIMSVIAAATFSGDKVYAAGEATNQLPADSTFMVVSAQPPVAGNFHNPVSTNYLYVPATSTSADVQINNISNGSITLFSVGWLDGGGVCNYKIAEIVSPSNGKTVTINATSWSAVTIADLGAVPYKIFCVSVATFDFNIVNYKLYSSADTRLGVYAGPFTSQGTSYFGNNGAKWTSIISFAPPCNVTGAVGGNNILLYDLDNGYSQVPNIDIFLVRYNRQTNDFISSVSLTGDVYKVATVFKVVDIFRTQGDNSKPWNNNYTWNVAPADGLYYSDSRYELAVGTYDGTVGQNNKIRVRIPFDQIYSTFRCVPQNTPPSGNFSISCDSNTAVLSVTANTADAENPNVNITANVSGAVPGSRKKGGAGSFGMETFQGSFNTTHTVTGTVSDSGGLSAGMSQASVTCPAPPNVAPSGTFTISCDSAAVLTVTANVSDAEGGTLTATANVDGSASPASRTDTRTNSGAITFATFQGAYNTAHTVTGTVSDPGGLSATITQASATCLRPAAVFTCTATTSATPIYMGASFKLYITIDNNSSQYALPMNNDTHKIVASAGVEIENFGPNSDPNNIYVYPKGGLKYNDKDHVITDDDLISKKEGSYNITITVGVIDCSTTVQIVQPPPILSCNSGASFSESEFGVLGTLSTIVLNETLEYGPKNLEITSRVYSAVDSPIIDISGGSSDISTGGDIIDRTTTPTRTITQGATMAAKGTYGFKLTVKYKATMDDKTTKEGEVQCNGSQVSSSKPYLKVYGGDVWAGAKWPNGTDCNVSDKGIYAFTKRKSDGTFNGSGSSAQLTVTSLLSIGQFYSASQRTASPTPPNGLTFANTSTDGEYGGNYAKGASISRCMPNYESTKKNKIDDITGISNYQTHFNDLTRGSGSTYQFYVNGDFASSVTSWPQGLQAALYVSGEDVYIGNNIEYAAANSSDVNQIPRLQLIVIGGNIYIGKDVTRLDGLFVAQPSGSTGGRIYTCAKSMDDYTAKELVEEGCNKQLAVNGQFVADKVRFLRTIGTVRDSTATEIPDFVDGNGTKAAEVFNFSPLDYLAPSALQDPWSTGGSVRPYQSVVSLPPIY